MRDTRRHSHRLLLLATVATAAIAGSARAANYNNSAPVTNTGASYTLGSGDALTNSSSITSTGAGQAAVLAGSGVSAITNSGVIQGTGANGLGIQVVSGGSVGSITNSGTVQGGSGGTAILVGDTIGAGASVGTLTNSGVLQANGSASALQVDPGSSVAAIVNSGTLGALGSGSAVNALGSIGMIANSGVVQSALGAAVAVAATGSIGAISNSGAISGFADGVLNSGTIGSIVNSGRLVSSSGTAVAMGSTGIITNGLTNTASGLIQGGPSDGSGTAIDNSSGAGALTIDTAGTIVGAIKLGPAGDTLNVTGGSITGAIIGLTGSGDALNFSPSGTFATGGSIANVDSINVVSGTVAVQQPVSGAQSFDISPGAAAILNSSIGASSFYNAGLASVGTGSQTIAGNYTQASSGALGITVTNSKVGALTVTGDATFQGTLAVAAHVPTSVNVFALTGTNAVLTASTITAAGGSLAVSSDNSAISFGLADTGTQLLMSPLPLSSSQIQQGAANDVATIFAPISGIVNGNEQQGQQFLKQVFVGLANTQRLAVLNSIDNILTSLTPSQLLRFNDQLLPSTIQGMDLNLLTELNVLSGSEDHIDQREEMTRLEAEQTGLAAGDQVGRGITFWGQPFGAVTNQGQAGGFDGYDAATYGITFGGDELVMPNLRLGAAVSLSNSNVNYNGTLSGNNGNVFSGALDLYGIWHRNNFFVDGLLSFGYNHYTQHNLISALGVALDADSSGTEISGKIGVGYDYHLGNGAVLIPYGSLQQYHFNFGSYTTTGGSAYGVDMHVSGTSEDMTQSRLGAKLDYPVKLQSGVLTPNIHLYWLHDFGANNLTQTYTTSDLAGPNSFTMVGPSPGRDTINVGVGLAFAKGRGWALSGGYDYAGRSSLTGHNFYLELKMKF